jgi:hypothetical protein
MQSSLKKSWRWYQSPAKSRLYLSVESRAIVVFAIGAALYTFAAFLANEWLYLLAFSLLTAPIIGLIVPWLQVSAVTSTIKMPERISSQENAELHVTLQVAGVFRSFIALLPIHLLFVKPHLERRSAPGKPNETITSMQPFLIASLEDSIGFRFNLPSLNRGVYNLRSIEVSSGYPFGLVWLRRLLMPPVENSTLTVHPILVELQGQFLEKLDGVSSTIGTSFNSNVIAHQSSSVRSIREYRQGDSLRHVHWRTSARRGQLLVREYDSEQLPVFDVYLDLEASWKNKTQFELAVCTAHALIYYGFEMDMAPDLILNPALDSPPLLELMFDLPAMKSAMELAADMLSRVEPLPSNNTPAPRPNQNRPLIAITPCADSLLVGDGDEPVYPVFVRLVSGNITEDERDSSRATLATISDLASLARL